MKYDLRKNKFGVCILVWNINAPGGMERQAWMLAKGLAKRGVRVTTITSLLIRNFRPRDILWQKEIKDEVYVYKIPLKQWKYFTSIIFCLNSLLLMFSLRKKFDLIYGVQLYSYGAIASLAGKLMNKPVVVKIACGGYCGDIAMFSKLPLVWIAKIFAKWADVYVSLSKQIEGELKDAGFDKGEIINIPNGVDTSVFHPAESIEEKKRLRTKLMLPDKKIVVFVGRLDPQKRVDLLIGIFNEVHKIYDNSCLIIIGDGPEKDKIKSMLNEDIAFIGTVNNVEEYLRVSDLLVLPTLAEGMSNIILEAMATGLPVITTDVSSNPEVIDNGINGILLDAKDKEGFQRNIIRILDDESFANKVGQEARKKMLERFSIEFVSGKHLELFERRIQRRKM